jgi:hypothetical protein
MDSSFLCRSRADDSGTVATIPWLVGFQGCGKEGGERTYPAADLPFLLLIGSMSADLEKVSLSIESRTEREKPAHSRIEL